LDNWFYDIVQRPFIEPSHRNLNILL